MGNKGGSESPRSKIASNQAGEEPNSEEEKKKKLEQEIHEYNEIVATAMSNYADTQKGQEWHDPNKEDSDEEASSEASEFNDDVSDKYDDDDAKSFISGDSV
jgi:hypothetical protein